ncbi:MAG: hypothetical protein H6839_04375 [Planctomycetes bacterium]|nr:hypothetical protein [Planctomycetota bacterium]
MSNERASEVELTPYGNVGALQERHAECRRAAARNGKIGFCVAIVAVVLALGFVGVNAFYGGGPPAFGAVVFVILLLPAWPFFRKKSALETESYAIERELKALEAKARTGGQQ